MYLSMRQWTRKKPPNLAREIYNFVLHRIYKIPNASTYDKWCSCHRTPPWCDFHAPILSPLHSASMVGGQCCVRNPWHGPTMWHPLAPKYKRVRASECRFVCQCSVSRFPDTKHWWGAPWCLSAHLRDLLPSPIADWTAAMWDGLRQLDVIKHTCKLKCTLI